MAQKYSVNKRFVLNSDVLSVLHELMHAPGGSLKYSRLQHKVQSHLTNDIKRLALHCFQHSYIDYDGYSIQLTDAGLQYYLNQKKSSLRYKF